MRCRSRLPIASIPHSRLTGCHGRRFRGTALSSGANRPAGEGDGELPEVLDVPQRRGFTDFAALEPHLDEVGDRGGYSGPVAFEVATRVLRDVPDDVDAANV